MSEGRPLGMPPWGPQLGTEKIWQVLAYLETLPRQSEPGIGSPEYEAAELPRDLPGPESHGCSTRDPSRGASGACAGPPTSR